MENNTYSVLIADDDSGDRKILRRTLEKIDLDCDIVEAKSLEEADEACKHHEFNCAFIDYMMPGGDGLEGIARLKEFNPYMAIIMATGEGDEKVASEAIKLGAMDYITKNMVSPQSIERILKHSLETLQLKKQVDQKQEELKKFSLVLAHDIKSPIAQILQLCNLMAGNIKQGNTDNFERNTNLLIRAAEHSLNLIKSLEEYNLTDNSNISFEKVSMDNILSEVLNILSPAIADKNATVTSDALPEITANAAQIGQLLQNLINNGIKYCEAQTPAVYISATEQDDSWLFSVADNGIGIKQEYVDQIFEPFQRLHTNKEYEGTGLGLATCRKIVENHKGRIWCKSEEGKGTTFYFTVSKSL